MQRIVTRNALTRRGLAAAPTSVLHQKRFAGNGGGASDGFKAFAQPSKKKEQDISPVTMQYAFPSMRAELGGETVEEREALYLKQLEAEGSKRLSGDDAMPKLTNVFPDSQQQQTGKDDYLAAPSYRVSWFDYDVHPSVAFMFWAVRRLRDLPPDWQRHYKIYLRQEVKSQMYLNTTWDMFIAVVDGYRKGKWILRKFDVPVDESLIPHPYNDFWEVTTPEERAWAFRRSSRMKETQANQRYSKASALTADSLWSGQHDDAEAMEAEEEQQQEEEMKMKANDKSVDTVLNLSAPNFGGGKIDFMKFSNSGSLNSEAKSHDRNEVHSQDMGAPSERDILSTAEDGVMGSDFVMSTIEDDKLWNPVLKNRLHRQQTKQEEDLYAFEDDDEFEAPPATPRRC